MTLFILVLIIGFVLFFLSSWLGMGSLFARWKTFHEGTYNGVPYVLQEREEKGFSTNHIDYRIRLGDLPPAEISPTTTDWGVPYSNDIFDSAPYCYTTPNIPAYRSEDEDPTDYQPFRHDYTLLYLSPKTASKADYDQYCGFMKSEWPTIDSLYAENKYTHFSHLIGLVYARQNDITKIYKGSYKPYPVAEPGLVHKAYIRIQNDGRVELVDEDEASNTRYSGLSHRVQMPGKRLYLDTDWKNGGLGSLKAVRTFKDDRGRSPDMDFQIVENTPEACGNLRKSASLNKHDSATSR